MGLKVGTVVLPSSWLETFWECAKAILPALRQNFFTAFSWPALILSQEKHTRTRIQPHNPRTMERLLTLLSYVLLLASIPFASALKFDIDAHPAHLSGKHERCIRNFVAKEQLVVVTTIVSGYRGDGQLLNLHVCLSREYRMRSSANHDIEHILTFWARSRMLWAMSTPNPRMSLMRTAMPLPPTPTPLLTFASRIS